VQTLQSQFHVTPEATTLIGFSQGGIMALEATQQPIVLARRVIGLSTRFGASPKTVPWSPVTLVHGDQDTVILHAYAQQAHDEIAALGGDVTLNVVSGLAHQINHDVTALIIRVLNPA
jgi:phospholipase/carboxylesterase